MIIYVLISLIFAKKGFIIPEVDETLHLSILPDSSVRFLDKKNPSKVGEADVVQYDEKKKRIILKERNLCKVNEVSSPLVSTCQDTFSFVTFKKISEAGMFKFVTDLDNCLTLGSKDKQTGGYFVHATKCKPNESYQRFKFVNLDPEETSKRKSDPRNELFKLYKILSEDDNKQVTIVIKEEPNDFVYKTNVRDFNDFLSMHSAKKLLNHDSLVDKDLSLLGEDLQY